ncbi:MAG: hypothetical protein P8N67_11665 [Pseudomonadales bacterium]|nr:hypothetical protein [Pseudomonadales bacterium]
MTIVVGRSHRRSFNRAGDDEGQELCCASWIQIARLVGIWIINKWNLRGNAPLGS